MFFFLILYSVNSLRTGVVAIAEREKAKKEIEEIQVKANLLNAFFSTDVLLEKINDTFNNTFTLIWNESRSGAKRIAV